MPDAPFHTFLSGPLPDGVGDVLARLRRTEGVAQIAVMPDVHLASEFCVGTVVASSDFLFPNAVGGDIGCGMLALRFDGTADSLRDPDRAARILGQLQESCPARRHHRRTAHALPPELRDRPLSGPRLEAHKLSTDCITQLGTLGAGNHFLELQQDETNTLWLMIHTGSRHLGQCILHHFLPKSRRLETNIFALPADSPEGRAYLADVQIARQWASTNRQFLAQRAAEIVERILGTPPQFETLIDADHNHVQLEQHTLNNTPRQLLIHRKGATAAAENQPGLIPGSMGTRSFHTRGKGHNAALRSSSHGAGRALSRTEARNKITISALRQQLRQVWYDQRLERHLREEAPTAYKDVDKVMSAQEDLTTIIRRLKPLLVYKGV